MRFKTDWASLIVGSEFTVFALFYFVFEGNFPSTSPRAPYIWWGDLTVGFLRYGRYEFEGLISGGAYFRNFTVFLYLVRFCLSSSLFWELRGNGVVKNFAILSIKPRSHVRSLIYKVRNKEKVQLLQYTETNLKFFTNGNKSHRFSPCDIRCAVTCQIK